MYMQPHLEVEQELLCDSCSLVDVVAGSYDTIGILLVCVHLFSLVWVCFLQVCLLFIALR